MGNRAIVKPIGKYYGVYLHWNGGIDSVTAFLEYCKLKGYRDFNDGYGVARFCQVVSNYFGGTYSIGIEGCDETEESADWLDNGIYVIDGWDIVKRIGNKTEPEGYDLMDLLLDIDEAQPKKEQLGKDFLNAEVVDVSEIAIGDKVYTDGWDGKKGLYTVVGIAPDDTWCNGNVSNLPFVDKYCNDGCYSKNPNNYLHGKVRRVKRANGVD